MKAGLRRHHEKVLNSELIASDGRSLTNLIVERLREGIIDQTYRPGDVLVERRLADLFGTSKTPVREALMQLQQEDLLRSIPRAGYLVSKVSVDEVHSIFHLRQLLEREAVTLAARHATAADLNALEKYVSDLASIASTIESGNPDSSGELARYRNLNRKFHVALAQASKNSLLAEFIDRLIVSSERLLNHDILTAPNLSELDREHRPIVRAIRRGDISTAAQLMVKHISRTKERILRTL